MKKNLFALFATVALLAGVLLIPSHAQQNSSYVAGRRIAQQFAYGFGSVAGAHVAVGNSATGTQTVTVCPAVRSLADGRVINLFVSGVLNPVTFDLGTASSETVTPTAVSIVGPGGLTVEADQNCAAVTASFSFTHAPSQFLGQVRSGSNGLDEAISDAAGNGLAPNGAVIVLDPTWGGTNAIITAAPVYQGIVIEDDRSGVPAYWGPLGGATTLAAPSTLTATTVGFAINGANSTGGSWVGTNTYNYCIAYVDILGQEGPCSATFSAATAGTGSTNQIGFSAPAASAGAVGYTPYITLSSGSYGLNYKVPLVSQPATAGVAPVSNGVCTLTKVETITPACAVANTTYNQSGSAAIVSALTLNTSPINPQVTVVSSTSQYIPNAGGRTTYTYAPMGLLGSAGIMPSRFLPFTIGAAAGTTVPDVVGTVNLSPNLMNVLGRTIRVCGTMTTTASTATIVDVQFQWDSMGQNTAGAGVLIGDLTATPSAAIATAGHATFCQDFTTITTSASATGGKIQSSNGFGGVGGLTLLGTGALSDALAGASAGGVGSLNLAVDARINVIYLHTTGTDGAGWTLQSLTAQVL